MNDDRLQDAVGADVLGKLPQLAFRELGARIVRILIEEVDRSEQWFACGNGTGAEEVGLVRLGRLWSI
jgi:hypothetical protein